MRRIVFALMTLSLAREKKADAIAVLGDLVSYPSEAGVEWAKAVLDSCEIPWFYTTGNHDWHYEGMEGSEIDLREEWTRKRLLPLYKGYNHECYSVTVKGIKLIFVDNATYQILPSQLKAFSAEIKGKEPKLLFGHIPYYAPGYGITTVAHPATGILEDRYTLEVTSPEVPNPVAVRYCSHNWTRGTLYNCFGIPALPFRSDR